MKKTFCFTLLLFTHNCILVYMAMKKSLFLLFLFLTAQRYIKNINYQNFS